MRNVFVQRIKKSSCLTEIWHDGIALMSVRFTSNPEPLYQYYPVTLAQVKRIINAESAGKMFHEEIRNDPDIVMIRKITRE